MEAFHGYLPLRPGDVVEVPLNVPHSLQHGVRTIEFQTPVYERKIISFCQQVLTQQDWDTRDAVELMELVAPSRPDLPRLNKLNGRGIDEGVVVEEVVCFSDFRVVRVALSSMASCKLQAETYRLLIVVQGSVVVRQVEVHKEEAVLLPASHETTHIRCGYQSQTTLPDSALTPDRKLIGAMFLLAIPS